jgi:hypothetical protein
MNIKNISNAVKFDSIFKVYDELNTLNDTIEKIQNDIKNNQDKNINIKKLYNNLFKKIKQKGKFLKLIEDADFKIMLINYLKDNIILLKKNNKKLKYFAFLNEKFYFKVVNGNKNRTIFEICEIFTCCIL